MFQELSSLTNLIGWAQIHKQQYKEQKKDLD